MERRKLGQLIFSLALVTLTFLALGVPQAEAQSCVPFCERQWNRCMDQGRPIEECDDNYIACLNAC
jgi:hypothetical protein